MTFYTNNSIAKFGRRYDNTVNPHLVGLATLCSHRLRSPEKGANKPRQGLFGSRHNGLCIGMVEISRPINMSTMH